MIGTHNFADEMGVRNRHPKGIGIEVELEGFRGSFNQFNERNKPKGWWAKQEGSLRDHGVEIVSDPLTPFNKKAKDALKAFDAIMKQHKLRKTERCGTHMHVAITDLSINELFALFTVYTLIEPDLFSEAGELREDNIFCVPWGHQSETLATTLGKMATCSRAATSNGLFELLRKSGNKYMALNFNPTTRLGTVEFRMLPAISTAKELERWMVRLDNVRSISRELGVPKEVRKKYKSLGRSRFLRQFDLRSISSGLDIDLAEDLACCIEPKKFVKKDEVEWDALLRQGGDEEEANIRQADNQNGLENRMHELDVRPHMRAIEERVAQVRARVAAPRPGIGDRIMPPPEPQRAQIRAFNADHLHWVGDDAMPVNPEEVVGALEEEFAEPPDDLENEF